MATLSQLQARLDKMEAALASGVLEIRHGDERLTYRSVAEISAAIASVQMAIAEAGGGPVPVRSFKLTSCKDL
jgi:hypothetical protein